MFDNLISVKKINVNGLYFKLCIFRDHITLHHIYFLNDGSEDLHKKEFENISSSDLFDIISKSNIEYINDANYYQLISF